MDEPVLCVFVCFTVTIFLTFRLSRQTFTLIFQMSVVRSRLMILRWIQFIKKAPFKAVAVNSFGSIVSLGPNRSHDSISILSNLTKQQQSGPLWFHKKEKRNLQILPLLKSYWVRCVWKFKMVKGFISNCNYSWTKVILFHNTPTCLLFRGKVQRSRLMLSCMIWSLNKEKTDQFYISLHWLRSAIRNLVLVFPWHCAPNRTAHVFTLTPPTPVSTLFIKTVNYFCASHWRRYKCWKCSDSVVLRDQQKAPVHHLLD